jgi:uncharacterized protein (DUF58 family)
MSEAPRIPASGLLRKCRDAILHPIRLYRQFIYATIHVHTRLTREGLQFIFMICFILLGAVLRDVNLLVILAGTLIAMMVIQWRICTRTILDLIVDRRLPRSIHARRPFEIELIVKNPKSWLGAWLVLVQDRMVYAPFQTTINRASQTISLLFMSVPPRTSRTQRYRCVAERRGRYQLMGIEITTRFPLGLMRGILNQKESLFFVVQPALGRLLPQWKELFNIRESGARHRRVRSLSDEGEFFGLRSYRPGDSPRWIHWRSSARRDELVVKQFQQPESRELFLLLDMVIPPESDVEARKAYIKVEDTAVEFVATLVHQMTTSNAGAITVAIADSQPTVASRIAARSQAFQLMDRLANARGGKEPQLIDALHLLEQEHRHIDHLIVISTRAMPNSLTQDKITEAISPFWRSFQWIDVHADESSRYFLPAD